MADGASLSQDEWLKQFDVSLPGCTLKKQVDILALIKQVSHSVCPQRLTVPIVHVQLWNLICVFAPSRRSSQTKRTSHHSTATQPM